MEYDDLLKRLDAAEQKRLARAATSAFEISEGCYTEAAAAIRSLQAKLDAVRPRPIEDAPKDGRGLLLISGKWYVAGSWHKTANCWINSGPTYERLTADEQPTHFIPLSALTSLGK